MAVKDLPIKNNKILLFVIFFIIVSVLFIYILLVYLLDNPTPKADIPSNGRNYSFNPFDINDAISVCRDKAQKKIGSSLQYSVVNDHSTRYDPKRDIYFVVLDTYIESTADNSENQIYCHVDAKEYVVNYLKTQNTKQRELSLDFFK